MADRQSYLGRAATLALLLATWAPAPGDAHARVVVDKRTLVQIEADEQRRELEEMRNVNADARQHALQLQRDIAALQAEVVDRGLMLTLDDVLFAGNSARLSADGSERLDELTRFLDAYPYRSAQIESSAVCKGSVGYDALLSQRRAVAVASYLMRQGIASARVSARNKESSSDDEGCDAPRLHGNRQVIVIIANVMTSATQP